MRPDSAVPEEWLRFALSDLCLASRREDIPDVLLDTLASHCQQAAEKAIKAVLVARGIAFPRIHNIRSLIALLPLEDQPVGLVADAAELTELATAARYPGDLEEMDEDEYAAALETAAAVVAWAESVLQR